MEYQLFCWLYYLVKLIYLKVFKVGSLDQLFVDRDFPVGWKSKLANVHVESFSYFCIMCFCIRYHVYALHSFLDECI
jgi:hypothetical protein